VFILYLVVTTFLGAAFNAEHVGTVWPDLKALSAFHPLAVWKHYEVSFPYFSPPSAFITQ